MPHFVASRVVPEKNQTAFEELYELNVLSPIHPDYDPRALLRGFVTPEVDETHIAEQLARAFGAKKPGDMIEVTLQEIVGGDAVRGFRLPVVVRFAAANRGSEYLQIGLDDLLEYFQVQLAEFEQAADDPWLELSLKPDSDRQCTEDDLED